MCITKACEEPTAQGVWWRDDAQWCLYDAVQAAAIQQAISDGTERVQLGNLASSKYARGARYVVDLITMKQRNLATGYSRDVKVVGNAPAAAAAKLVPSVNAPGPIATLMAQVRACQETIQSFQKMVEKLAVELLAFKLRVESEANSAFTATMNRVSRSGLRVSDSEDCESAGEYWPDSSSTGEYCPDSSSDD